MADRLLELADVNAFYGTSHVLHDVSLSLEEGQTVSLIGRNGAGKTTTLRAIMGLTTREGSIMFRGEAIEDATTDRISRLGCGFIPEDRRIFPSLTVHENLVTGIVDSEDEQRIDEVYDMFPRLRDRRSQMGTTLSGGEQQMLAIARTLVSDPDLILIDEPSEGLMPSLVEQVKETVVELNESGHTILLVEQNANMAFEVSDYVYVIDKGQIRAQDEPEALRGDEEIKQRYLSI